MAEDCPRDFPMANRITSLEDSNKRHGETHREIFGRLNNVERENAVQNAKYDAIMSKLDSMDRKNDNLHERLISIESVAATQAQTLNELNERGKDNQKRLNEMEAKPGKKWENMTDKFSGGVIGGLATLLVGGIVLLLAFASGLINIVK